MTQPTDAAAQAALLLTETGRLTALERADVATLRRLFADDLRYIHSSGRIESKEQLLTAIETGSLRYLALDSTSVRVTRQGSTAWIESQLNFTVEFNGVQFSKQTQCLGIWRLEKSGWRLAACANVPRN